VDNPGDDLDLLCRLCVRGYDLLLQCLDSLLRSLNRLLRNYALRMLGVPVMETHDSHSDEH
jgi:hypothetical protein